MACSEPQRKMKKIGEIGESHAGAIGVGGSASAMPRRHERIIRKRACGAGGWLAGS